MMMKCMSGIVIVKVRCCNILNKHANNTNLLVIQSKKLSVLQYNNEPERRQMNYAISYMVHRKR